MRFTSLLTITAGLCTAPTAFAWGAAGHEIVATVAQIYLHPTVLPTLCSILNYTAPDCNLAPIAAWADRIRYKARWSASLHYIGAKDDHPSDTCAFPGEKGWTGRRGANVLGAIHNVTGILQEYAQGGSDDGAANEALKFLVHFLGDLHMPLHLTGRDRGGNGDKVRFDGRITNLHSLWDGLLIAQRIRTLPHNYTRPIPIPGVEQALRGAIYDPYVRRLIWEGTQGRWHDELDEWLACPTSARVRTTSWVEVFFPGWQQVLDWARGTTTPEEEADDNTLCPYAWATPIHALNCELVWPKALDEPPYSSYVSSFSLGRQHEYLELDTPEYSGVIRDQWVVERLLAMAGVRLAGVLNWLFADGEGVREGLYLYRN